MYIDTTATNMLSVLDVKAVGIAVFNCRIAVTVEDPTLATCINPLPTIRNS